MSMEKTKKAARLIPEEERMDFLPGHFRYFLNFEQGAYAWMNRFDKEYGGGFWHFYETEDGAPFMVPAEEREYHLSNEMNFHEQTMSAEAAGLVVSVMAISDLMWSGREQERMAQYYEKLMDYIGEHPEGAKIYSILD